MGMTVTNNLVNDIKGKTLVAYNFNVGNEYILYMMDSKGNETRVRIPASIRDLLFAFTNIEMCGEKVA